MKKYIVAGIMAAALLASGCGDFIRNELITMQNEIDILYKQVDEMNKGLANLHGIVEVMASNGYIVEVQEFDNEGRGGYTLKFRTVKIDASGGVVSEETYSLDLLSGIDGKDGQDAEPFVVSVKQDTVDKRWYWYDAQEDKWLESKDGERFLVDGKDGKTPYLKVEDGYWFLSWDEDPDNKNWEETGWKAKGEDAKEIFSDARVLDDRVELVLAKDSTVLTLLRYLPVEVKLTTDDKELTDSLKIAPGETVSISYTLSGTEAAKALLVAGTDGRLKTAIQKETDTTGVVKVTCPDAFPEGGYIYITLNDGNGRSTVRVVHFIQRAVKVIYGDTDHAAKADAETGVSVTFETNSELEATCIFPEGVEPWITATMEAVDNLASLKYDIKANTSKEARTGVIVISPKDNPGFEVARITVTQEGA
ncbi:MAG: hypothetical protein IK076_01870 [Bacteroidales bacterium]|nr:hypothetical protein [Bacteroidales bacterium]